MAAAPTQAVEAIVRPHIRNHQMIINDLKSKETRAAVFALDVTDVQKGDQGQSALTGPIPYGTNAGMAALLAGAGAGFAALPQRLATGNKGDVLLLVSFERGGKKQRALFFQAAGERTTASQIE